MCVGEKTFVTSLSISSAFPDSINSSSLLCASCWASLGFDTFLEGFTAEVFCAPSRGFLLSCLRCVFAVVFVIERVVRILFAAIPEGSNKSD